MKDSLFSVNSNQKLQWYGLWTNASEIENKLYWNPEPIINEIGDLDYDIT